MGRTEAASTDRDVSVIRVGDRVRHTLMEILVVGIVTEVDGHWVFFTEDNGQRWMAMRDNLALSSRDGGG